MTANDLLIQSLIAASTDTDAVMLEDGSHIDWSTPGDLDGPRMEVGDSDGNAVSLELRRDDVARIQRALTLWLIQNPA
jgi:hypothetical protein